MLGFNGTPPRSTQEAQMVLVSGLYDLGHSDYPLPKQLAAGLQPASYTPAVTNLKRAPASETKVSSPQEALLSAYIKEVPALPFVEAVWADDVAGLTIYTVYRGDPDEIDTDLYLAYQRMYQMFPLAMADFRMVPVERAGALPRSARRLFARA